jgi:hypothetical protein
MRLTLPTNLTLRSRYMLAQLLPCERAHHSFAMLNQPTPTGEPSLQTAHPHTSHKGYGKVQLGDQSESRMLTKRKVPTPL